MNEYSATDGVEPAHTPSANREKSDVKAWFERLEAARKFDEPAREQYAKDRKYARGDSGFEVDANLVGTNIDILESFLYARDPDFDVAPGPCVRPPSADAVRDAVEDVSNKETGEQAAMQGLKLMQQALMTGMDAEAAMTQAMDAAEQAGMPEHAMTGLQAGLQALQQGAVIEQAIQIGEQTAMQAKEQAIQTQVDALRKAYAKRNRDIKAFAETCEIIGAKMWSEAGLRRRGRPWIRSGLTIGLGVLKATWQERSQQSPETSQAINDLQANMEKARALQAEITEKDEGAIARMGEEVGYTSQDIEARLADYERQLAALNGKVERVSAKGMAIDVVAGEDFQVSPGFTIPNHLDAPWNAHRIFMRCEDGYSEFSQHLSQYGDPKKILASAIKYTARKPVMIKTESGMMEKSSHKEADGFVQGEGEDSSAEFLALWEVWDRDSNTVLTGIEGVCYWVKPQWTPPATTRFYPFFTFTTSEVDGQRHPQSLTTRTMKLVDEYNRIGSAEAEHRRRIRPKTAINGGMLDAENVKKLENGGTQEMVILNPTQPNANISNIIHPVIYAGIDAALYDRGRIIQEIERVWAIQEALGGAVNQPKTATEAEIQNTGFQARTGGRRDVMEVALSELARYTVELARVYVTEQDARTIAGPDAIWPSYGGPDDLVTLLNVEIRAGSSGKPNTSAERQAWSTMLPLLQQGIMQIGQLRSAAPTAIADSLEQLMRITAEKSGDRFDIDSLIPQAGDMPMPGMIPGQPGQPPTAPASAPAGPVPAMPEVIQ